MMRPLLAVAALAAAAAAPASAGTCVTRNVPARGDVTVCVTDRGCDLYLDPGGRIIALCVERPFDTAPLGACTAEDLPTLVQVCVLTPECTVFVSNGRPPGLCL